ncbi:hypothetical protein [Maritalea porphyrae]|uniref:hypothetical protein n=1 Tax=Maritalea porphyrae TaxID=880732 RepID=UPI0022AF6482|nr:hypothetical protein [Maritalea porphyrae]MCZ4273220.1 hypothetical protein [Maritalea porphyrae]
MFAILKKAFLAAIIVLFPHQASADFLNSYARWKGAHPLVQQGYVMGIYDRTLKVWSNEEGEKAVAVGVSKCVKDLEINSVMMSEAVDYYYKTNTSRWSEGAFYIFHDAIVRGVCLQFVNEQRSLRGLDPWVVSD